MIPEREDEEKASKFRLPPIAIAVLLGLLIEGLLFASLAVAGGTGCAPGPGLVIWLCTHFHLLTLLDSPGGTAGFVAIFLIQFAMWTGIISLILALVAARRAKKKTDAGFGDRPRPR